MILKLQSGETFVWRNQSVTFVKFLTQTNVRMYSCRTNLHKRMSKYQPMKNLGINVQKSKRTNLQTNLCKKYIEIFEYLNVFVTLCCISRAIASLMLVQTRSLIELLKYIQKRYPCNDSQTSLTPKHGYRVALCVRNKYVIK